MGCIRPGRRRSSIPLKRFVTSERGPPGLAPHVASPCGSRSFWPSVPRPPDLPPEHLPHTTLVPDRTPAALAAHRMDPGSLAGQIALPPRSTGSPRGQAASPAHNSQGAFGTSGRGLSTSGSHPGCFARAPIRRTPHWRNPWIEPRRFRIALRQLCTGGTSIPDLGPERLPHVTVAADPWWASCQIMRSGSRPHPGHIAARPIGSGSHVWQRGRPAIASRIRLGPSAPLGIARRIEPCPRGRPASCFPGHAVLDVRMDCRHRSTMRT